MINPHCHSLTDACDCKAPQRRFYTSISNEHMLSNIHPDASPKDAWLEETPDMMCTSLMLRVLSFGVTNPYVVCCIPVYCMI